MPYFIRLYWLRIGGYIFSAARANGGPNLLIRQKMHRDKFINGVRNSTNGRLNIDELKSYSSISDGILPAPALLESYEELAPGTVKSFAMLIQNEQDYRHKMEMRQQQILKRTLWISALVLIFLIIGNVMLMGENTIFLNFMVCLLLFLLNLRMHKAYLRSQMDFGGDGSGGAVSSVDADLDDGAGYAASADRGDAGGGYKNARNATMAGRSRGKRRNRKFNYHGYNGSGDGAVDAGRRGIDSTYGSKNSGGKTGS